MSDKFVDINTSGIERERTPIVASTGVGDAGKIFVLDANGKVDPANLYGTSVKTYPVSESILAGAAIQTWNDSGTTKVRNANAATGLECNGFALTAQPTPGSNTRIVLDDEVLSGFVGLTADATYFLSDTTPGGITTTPPTTATYLLQRLGKADGTTILLVDISAAIIRG